MGGQKKWYHMKVKSKISYLGKKISILPWQMAEQLAVEGDVKNVTDILTEDRRTSPFILFRALIGGPLGPPHLTK